MRINFSKTIVISLLMSLVASCSSDTAPSLVIKGSGSATATTAAFKFGNIWQASLGNWNLFVPSWLQVGRAATGPGRADVVKIKFYKLHISPNVDCSASVVVQDYGAAGVVKDLALGENLFEGAPSGGTYKCVVLEMSDIITFSPDSTASAAAPSICANASEYTFDIYRTNSGDTWKNLDGGVVTATGDGVTMGDDKVFQFASTDSAALLASTLAPHANQSSSLASALVVPGNSTFYADSDSQISNDSGSCGLEGLTLGFR